MTLSKGQLVFEYPAKGAKQREQAVAEDRVCAVVRSLLRRRGGGDQLLAYRAGPRWYDVTAADINEHLREISGVTTPPRTSAPGTPLSWPRWAWPCPNPPPAATGPASAPSPAWSGR